MFSSILLAIKFNEDDYYSNSYYAKVAGITLEEINLLEFEFLRLIKYQLYIKTAYYTKYHDYLRSYNLRQ